MKPHEYVIATLGKNRQSLPENSIFEGMGFEVQIRTILQHAWAEFEHDRNYKFAGVLPVALKRRVLVLAGSLEVIDREFDSISNEVDRYATSIADKTESGDLAIPIDSTSLKAYLDKKFATLVKMGAQPTLNQADQLVIDELHDMGITMLRDLDAAIPQNFIEIMSKFYTPEITFIGLLRTIMLVKNTNLYFDKVWKNHWQGVDKEYAQQLEAFGVDISKYAKQYRFGIINRPKVKLDQPKDKSQS